jgi:hypothetical protein
MAANSSVLVVLQYASNGAVGAVRTLLKISRLFYSAKTAVPEKQSKCHFLVWSKFNRLAGFLD